jgi:hypothetical protein
MKKHLTGIIAVIIAVGLFAFSAPTQQKPAKSFAMLNYWVYNPGTGELGTSIGAFDPDTQQAALEAVSCADNGSIECARGYTSSTKPATQPEVDDFQDHVAHN